VVIAFGIIIYKWFYSSLKWENYDQADNPALFI
jgi:hypothetical protein